MSDQLPLEAYWMPYTGNRQFKRDPRIILAAQDVWFTDCLLYTSPSPRDRTRSRMPSSA